MKRAYSMVRVEPRWRSEAIVSGVERAGFTAVVTSQPDDVSEGDLLIVWNLGPRYYDHAVRARSRGAHVIVAENGYFSPDREGNPCLALARDGHNGSGFWFVGNEPRFDAFNPGIHDWRGYAGSEVIVAAQRGIGSPDMRSPLDFESRIVAEIQSVARRLRVKTTIRVRAHPGNAPPRVPLWNDLANAAALVTWSSNAANLATLWGVPSFRMSPHHVNDAVLVGLSGLFTAPEPERLAAFERLSWAQWSAVEVASGEAFRFLLQDVL